MKTTIIVSCLALFAAAPLSAALNVDDTETRTAATETAKERFERIESESQKAYREWVKEIRKKMADAEAKGEELTEREIGEPPLGPFVDEAKQATVDYAGTEDAVQFHIWLIEMAGRIDQEIAVSSLRTLIKDHATSEGLEPLCGMFEYFSQLVEEDEAASMLKKLEKESKSTKVQGYAAFARLSSVIDNAAFDSTEFADAKKEIMAVLERVHRTLHGA